MARDYMSVLEDKVLELEYQLEQRDKAFEESIKEKDNKIVALMSNNKNLADAYLHAYQDAVKHLGVNGMSPTSPQFLQDMFFNLEMQGYDESEVLE